MKRIAALFVLLTLVLGGCSNYTDTAQSQAETTKPTASQDTAESPKEEPKPAVDEPADGLTEEDATACVTDAIDTEKYQVEPVDDELKVGEDEASAHEYFVFKISDKAGASVGQVAVDSKTGEKYNYLGDGTLDAYDTFPLYNPSVDAVCDWAGNYTGPAAASLEVIQGDSSSFEYLFSDGTTGTAQITGNTAQSADEKISFLFADQVITVAGGGVTGNYTMDAV